MLGGMRTPLLIAIVGLLLAGSSACTDHVECLYHSDCPAQEMCSDAHKCELGDKLDCKSDEDCGSEAVCTARGCLAKPDCENDASCPDGYRCDRYECRVDACTSAADCLGGEACSGGHCAACSVNSDCGAYEICRAARCVLQECRSGSDCGAGLLCRANGCYAPLTSARFEVQEGAIQEIPLPADATVTNAGGSTLGSMRVAGGALQFQAGCTAGSEQVETSVRLSDGSVQVLTSTLTVVDPGAPAAFSVSLTDIPNAEAVQAALVAPPENEGSNCPVKRYSFSWSNGEPGSEELSFPEAEVGSSITQLHAVPAGETVELVVRATDETGAFTEARAAVETAAVKFTRLELSENPVDPGVRLEANFHVTNAASVEPIYDDRPRLPFMGHVSDNTGGDYSWSFISRAHDSTIQFKAIDTEGGEHLSEVLTLNVRGTDETEPNNSLAEATPMASIARGRVGLDEGDSVDFWVIDLPYEGGSIRASSLPVNERSHTYAQSPATRVALISPSGDIIATNFGRSAGVQGRDVSNLAAGKYYFRIEPLEHTYYAYHFEVLPPECGNGFTETLAGEPCDGGEYCTDECTTTLSMTSEDNLRFPRSLEVHGERYRGNTVRFATHMTEAGWVDVGIGDYASNDCEDTTNSLATAVVA